MAEKLAGQIGPADGAGDESKLAPAPAATGADDERRADPSRWRLPAWLGRTADLGLAASLYGAERLLRRPAEGAAAGDELAEHRAEDDLAALAATVRDRLGPLARAVCRAGEDLRAAGPELWRSPTAARVSSSSGEAPGQSSGRSSALARQELRNRIEVYRQVAESRDTARSLPADLVTAADVVLGRAAHRRLWAWESLGYARTRAALHASPALPLESGRVEARGRASDEWEAGPRDLLCGPALRAAGRPGPASRTLPEEALPMLHAGMGLAFAEACLRDLGPGSSRGRVLAAFDRFVRLCRRNARADQEVGAWDSLGFVVRHQRPELLAACVEALDHAPHRQLAGFFWHGVGRAIYFLPMHFLPGLVSSSRALSTVVRDTPPGPARRQSMAGFGVAATLTNLRHPEVLAHSIESLDRLAPAPDGPEAAASVRLGDGFEEGVESALLIRGALIPDPEAIDALRRHRPAAGAEGAWRRWILEPVERASARPPCARGAGPFLALNRRLVAAAMGRGEGS